MLCQSVCSFHSPVCWSFCCQFVAIENVATDVPLCVNFDSASLPRRPIKVTLLTVRDAIFPCNVTYNGNRQRGLGNSVCGAGWNPAGRLLIGLLRTTRQPAGRP